MQVSNFRRNAMKYRKKPIEVDAYQFKLNSWLSYPEKYPMVIEVQEGFGMAPVIKTLEGNMYIHDGDYIIKGIKGEYYACREDIFNETYEVISD